MEQTMNDPGVRVIEEEREAAGRPVEEGEHGPAPPRIYVASLSDYNAGRLHGAWLEAAQSVEELEAGIGQMLAASAEPGAEEWAIHDSEGFNGLHIDEHEGLGFVARLGQGIAEHGLAFAHWAQLVSEPEELDRFEEAYLGRFESTAAYVEELAAETGINECLEQLAVPESLRPYVTFDVEGYARDLELSGDIATVASEEGFDVFYLH